MKSIIYALAFAASAAASAQSFDFGPANLASDLDTMNQAAVRAVVRSPSVAAYAAQKNLGQLTDVQYVYSGSLASGTFVVSTSKKCTFEARVRLADLGWRATPVAGSEVCR